MSAVLSLVILTVCIILFITQWLPMSVTGVLGCVLLVLSGAASFDTVFAGFSSDIVLLMVSAMVVGIAMFQTGIAQAIGQTIVKLSRGREHLFLAISCIVGGLLSMFVANTALVGIFIPIIDSACRASGSMKRRNLLLPITCAIMFGGACTLVGCTPQLSASSLMYSIVGVELGMWDLTGPGLCLLALFILYMLLFGHRRGENIWGKRPEANMNVPEEKLAALESEPPDRRRMTVMSVIMVLMVLSFIFGWLSTAMTALCAALLCIITGCCSMEIVVQEMQWKTVIFLGTCLGIGNALTESGAVSLIGDLVAQLFGKTAHPWLLFASMVLLTLLISQLITNSAAIIIILPITLSICVEYGFNPLPFCVGITLAASIACCTPLAASQIAMTQVAGYDFSDYLRFGWPLTLVGYAGILIFVPLFFLLS